MTAINKRRLGVFAALLTAACSSTAVRFHTLTAVDATRAAVPYSGAPLRVDAVDVPPAFDRLEWVSSGPGGEIKIHDFEQWSAPFPKMLRQTLAADLVRRLPENKIVFPHLSKSDGTLGLRVDILEITAGGGRTALRASWSIEGAVDHAARRGSALLTTTGSLDDSGQVVQTWNSLLGLLADRIAADLAEADSP